MFLIHLHEGVVIMFRSSIGCDKFAVSLKTNRIRRSDMTTYEPNMVLSEKEFAVVGTRPIRHDGADKVTGRAR